MWQELHQKDISVQFLSISLEANSGCNLAVSDSQQESSGLYPEQHSLAFSLAYPSKSSKD